VSQEVVPGRRRVGAGELPEFSDWDSIIKSAESGAGIFLQVLDGWLCMAVPDKGVCVKRESLLTDDDRKSLASFFADPSKIKTGHGLKPVIRCLGLEFSRCGPLFDAEIAAYCLNPSARSYDFFKLTAEYLCEAAPVLPAPEALAEQSVFIWKLKEALGRKMLEQQVSGLYEDMEAPLIPVFAAMESRGIGIDVKQLGFLGRELDQKMLLLQAEINELAGIPVNINSPKQLGFLLFEKLRLPAGRKNKTGYSTDEETLLSLSSVHEIVPKILQYREASKLKSAFVENLLESSGQKEGRIHTSLNQTGTSTGRISSSRPNLQNIPAHSRMGRAVRRAFVPKPGFVLLSADYSQIDLRVLAHVSGDEALVSAFEKGEDIHLKTACGIFGLAPEQVDKETRRRAKTVNFGIIYGQTASGLSAELGITREEAQLYIDNYFKTYAGVAGWIEENKACARQSGFVRTFTGRVRYIPEINSSNGNIRAFAERAAVNTPIQGGSADIIKKAMLAIHARACSDSSFTAQMLLQVHDELLFEIPLRDIEGCAGIIKADMENAFKLKIPLIVSLKSGANWQDMETTATEAREAKEAK